MSPVVRPWLSQTCSWKQQTVLLSSLRGCDGVQKEDPSKQLVRGLRAVLLHSASTRDQEATFMKPVGFDEACGIFLNNLDHYPVHWLMHFSHAVEIVAYKHPDCHVAETWWEIYRDLCLALHVGVESEDRCDERLRDDT